MLDKEFKKLEKQSTNLRIMIIIQFICLILIGISIVCIVGNYTKSSTNIKSITLSVSGFLAILGIRRLGRKGRLLGQKGI